MSDTAAAHDPVPPCVPRGGKALIGVVAAVVSGTLLLRYLHIEGIESAFMDMLTTPTVGLPILALFMGLLVLMVLMFVTPIWLIGQSLTERATNGKGGANGTFPTFCSLWSDETLCALGLLGYKRQREGRADAPAPAPQAGGEEAAMRRHGLSLLAIGVAWVVQLHAAAHDNIWSGWATVPLIVLPPFLAAAVLARWQKRSVWWLAQLGFILLFACVQVGVFAFLVHKAGNEANAALNGGLAILIYLAVLAVYLGANESHARARAGKNGELSPAFRATPAWAWRWLPFLASFVYLGVLTLFLSESFLLSRAAELAGIKSHNRQTLLQVPRDAEPVTGGACGKSAEATPIALRDWLCFDTAYHFGTIEILCAAPSPGGQTCYLARDGRIRFAFTRTPPDRATQPTGKNP